MSITTTLFLLRTMLQEHEKCPFIFGKYDRVKELLDQGLDVNERDYLGFTHLMTAALNGYYDMAALLIERGANLEARTLPDPYEPENDPGGDTALLCAVEHCKAAFDSTGKVMPNCLRTLRILLDAGANVNAKNNSGNTALEFAIQHRYREIAYLLIDYGADFEGLEFYRFFTAYPDVQRYWRWFRRRSLLLQRYAQKEPPQ